MEFIFSNVFFRSKLTEFNLFLFQDRLVTLRVTLTFVTLTLTLNLT